MWKAPQRPWATTSSAGADPAARFRLKTSVHPGGAPAKSNVHPTDLDAKLAEVKDLLIALDRRLSRGPFGRGGPETILLRGLLSFTTAARGLIKRSEREGRAVDFRYPNDADMGFDRTPVMFLRPLPARVIQLEPYLKRGAPCRI